MSGSDGENSRGLFGTVANSVKNAGIRRSLQRAVQRTIPASIFDVNSFVAVDFDLEEWRNVCPDEKWQHQWATQADFERIKIGGLNDQEISNFLDRKARAHFICKDGETVAYGWVIANYWDLFGWVRVNLAPGEIYSARAYVAFEHRGQRLQGELRKFAFSQLAAEGNKRTVSFIEMLNRSSLRAQFKPARRYVGRLWYIRIFGLVIFSIDGKWRTGFWNSDHPFELSFDMFDREAPSRPPKGAAT